MGLIRSTRSSGTGAIVFDDYRDNFVIIPGREEALEKFVNQTYAGQKHKLNATRSSNSEDALTWSCFDALSSLPPAQRADALGALWSLAFPELPVPCDMGSTAIHIGRTYGDAKEKTEVDVSIEGNGTLIFVEAKLFSPMSLADVDNGKPHDQIVRKLRVGLKEARRIGAKFFFLVLDIAPKEILRGLRPGASLAEARSAKGGGFASKWLTAYWFSRYKGGSSITPLRDALKDIQGVDAKAVADNMGWLVWTDVFKVTLKGVLAAGAVTRRPR